MYIICVAFYSINGQKISNSLKNKVIEWRHQLHQNPELSNKEYKTATFIEKNVEFVNVFSGAKDFSYYQLKSPGFYFFLGGKLKNIPEI